MSREKLFVDQLEKWLKGKQPKTLADLVGTFPEESFAVSLLLLMAVPALPLPTGGLTHVFEVIAILLSLELIVGRKTIWLPKRWQKINLAGMSERKTTQKLVKSLKWVENHTKPRLHQVLHNPLFVRITGIVAVVFCVTAFLAPPFSGLDTLPSLAVVLVALSIIFEDMLVYIIGLIVGVVGIGTVLTLGTAVFKSFRLLL